MSLNMLHKLFLSIPYYLSVSGCRPTSCTIRIYFGCALEERNICARFHDKIKFTKIGSILRYTPNCNQLKTLGWNLTRDLSRFDEIVLFCLVKSLQSWNRNNKADLKQSVFFFITIFSLENCRRAFSPVTVPGSSRMRFV